MSKAAKYLYVIENLPWTVGRKQLHSYFIRFGEIHSSKVYFDDKTGLSKGYAELTFTNHLDYDEMNIVHKIHGEVVKVTRVNMNEEN